MVAAAVPAVHVLGRCRPVRRDLVHGGPDHPRPPAHPGARTARATRQHRLRFVRSCSAPLPTALWQRYEEAIGVPLVEAYGMTEAAHQMASNPLPPGERRPGTVGRATGIEIVALDESWRPVAAGRRG